jgi:hypothetical protein
VAQIRILSWNIEVYGPEKYGRSVNAPALVDLVTQVVARTGANIVVVMETLSTVGDQVGFSLREGLELNTGEPWRSYEADARATGDRECYGIYWQQAPGQPFAPATDATGAPVQGLATAEFPNNFSNSNGRRASYVTFTSLDTNCNFTVTAYHAPPNARAIEGLKVLAGMPQLYTIANANPGPAGANVPGRLLCGDYNLDVNAQPEYSWLTDPVPATPPPTTAGQGAGCAPATHDNTFLMDIADAVKAWGYDPDNWATAASKYRRNLAIDNVFYATPAGGPRTARVVDVVSQIAGSGSIRAAAQRFARAAADGTDAFPNASQIPLPFSTTLSTMAYAFLFYRYAVSDHLPVSLSLVI